MATFAERMKSVWNAFSSPTEIDIFQPSNAVSSYGGFVGVRPDRTRVRIGNERTIISSVYTRIAIDVASVDFRHTRHDDSDRYLEDIPSGLNECLKVEANVDQAATAFLLDIALSLFDKGAIAIVPVDTTLDPTVSGSFDIKTMRVGEIVQWYPNHVRARVYNERIGDRQEIVLPKRTIAIVENPLYSVMNEPNSTLQRLIRKLSLLDSVDEASSSGKLDLIIQLPYVVKSETRRQQAEQRAKDIEFQLKGSQYGIAYTDGTEKITQLNRPVDNNLLSQIEYLTNQLYSELGITPEVMNGTANEAAMLNYTNRTVVPILTAIKESMLRVFLTKTARSQGQSIDFFRDPFKLVPMANLAEMVDKFTRNEVFTSNEMRQFIGAKPSKDPKADQLINSNMPQQDTGVAVPTVTAPTPSVVEDPSVTAPVVADTTPIDRVSDAIGAAFSAFGINRPALVTISPPNGEMDSDVLLSSLDELDKSIDDTFSGLGVDDVTS